MRAVTTLTLVALFAFAARAADEKPTIEVYKDKGGEYRWRLKAGNGKILAVPEDAYKSLADAKRAAGVVKDQAATLKAEFTVDKGKQHRWTLAAKNGRVMARSSEGYETKAGAEKGLATARDAAKDATIAEGK